MIHSRIEALKTTNWQIAAVERLLFGFATDDSCLFACFVGARHRRRCCSCCCSFYYCSLLLLFLCYGFALNFVIVKLHRRILFTYQCMQCGNRLAAKTTQNRLPPNREHIKNSPIKRWLEWPQNAQKQHSGKWEIPGKQKKTQTRLDSWDSSTNCKKLQKLQHSIVRLYLMCLCVRGGGGGGRLNMTLTKCSLIEFFIWLFSMLSTYTNTPHPKNIAKMDGFYPVYK